MHILKTDGGPHPAEMWADVSTKEILSLIELGPDAPASAMIDKRDLEVRLLRVLIAGHQRMMDFEREAIAKKGHHRLNEDALERDLVNAVVSDIVNATADTMFANHFRKNSTSNYLHELVANHFASSVHIERLWHTDRNPDNAICRSYRERSGAASLSE